MRVAIPGGSGLIGRALVRQLAARGDEVVMLSRDPARAKEAFGDEIAAAYGPEQLETALSGADAVINLAGEPVAQRWNAKVKELIRASRVDRTQRLVSILGSLPADVRPKVLVSSSASGYYGDGRDAERDESSPAGTDFLASVCIEWERAASGATDLGLRVALIRTGIVLARAGGALKTMLPPFRAGVGGRIGSGEQYMPWIHIDDIVGLYLAALSGDEWTGPINGGSPNPATNAEFTRELGRALHRPAVMPVPTLALKALYGEMAGVLVTGQRMIPAKPLALGYQFAYTSLPDALAAALG